MDTVRQVLIDHRAKVAARLVEITQLSRLLPVGSTAHEKYLEQLNYLDDQLKQCDKAMQGIDSRYA